MILYHGSNMVVDEPLIVKTKYAKDFGWGFYATTDFEQAAKWARRRALIKGGIPTVNQYEYTINSELDIVSFVNTDDDWLDFVAICRNGEMHRHDIVSGPMADDQVWDLVADYLSGDISKEEFLSAAKYKHPTDQTSFHTASALATLKFLGYKEV